MQESRPAAWNRIDDFRPDLEAFERETRPDGRDELALAHVLERARDHARDDPPPARVRRSHAPAVGSREEDRHAIPVKTINAQIAREVRVRAAQANGRA
jgi:hypothetical protein